MSDVIRHGRQEPMLPGLGQGATARPWTQNDVWVQADRWSSIVAETALVENAALIVYAVNHIEQAEADLQEALRLLGAVLYPSRVKEQGYGAYAEAKAAAGRLLARHAPQEAPDGK